ncbi:hypothetical protein OG530_01730 [Streptomyces decoyicus]|uniref:hypothetical protein n=1 Tax=Streptomyces decoyicus TaxID=249567 RepID=UPI002E195608
MPTDAMAQQGNFFCLARRRRRYGPRRRADSGGHVDFRFRFRFRTIADIGEHQNEEVSDVLWREIGSISDECLRRRTSQALG